MKLKKPFVITIRYKIPTFSSVVPFFDEGGRGTRKFWQAEILGIFSIEVAPKVDDFVVNNIPKYLIVFAGTVDA